MKRILVLGGTGDALQLARRLGPGHVYSLAGLGRVPEELHCHVRVGGFGGSEGLARYLVDENIALLIDATHPYAARISANAQTASWATGVPCWALRRPGWFAQPGDDWREADDWAGLIALLAPFRRPLFTLGREPLAHLDDIPSQQFWTVRCLDAHPGNARVRVIGTRGPFTPDGERELFVETGIDAVVSKNSGGRATEAKLDIARELGLPVLMLRRPTLPVVAHEFDSATTLLGALKDWPGALLP